MLYVEQVPVLSDNYIYLIHEPHQNVTAVVDPAQAAPVLEILAKKGWRLNFILNTHHHDDHVGGNKELKQHTNCHIVGFNGDKNRIPGIDITLKEGQEFHLGDSKAKIIFCPGHTLGHIAYFFEKEKLLFCGDTIFAMGCGRLFEGTAEQMWQSLKNLRQLPLDTQIYCAHEYTLNNARFAVTIEPHNEELKLRMQKILGLRAKNIPTIPSLMSEEIETNPFLRADQKELQTAIGMVGMSAEKVFAHIRLSKDHF